MHRVHSALRLVARLRSPARAAATSVTSHADQEAARARAKPPDRTRVSPHDAGQFAQGFKLSG